MIGRAMLAAALLAANGAAAQDAAGEGADGGADWRTPDPENILYMDLEGGRVVIELAPAFAPNHVDNLHKLVRSGFYDGLSIYRVVDGFVAQGGDVTETREPAEGARSVPAEFTRPAEGLAFTEIPGPDGFADRVGFSGGFPVGMDAETGEAWMVHCTGALAIARDADPDTGGSEFYIVTGKPPRYLDRNLTVVGRVLTGMPVVRTLAPGPREESGVIQDAADYHPLRGMAFAADVPAEDRVAIEVMRTDGPAFQELLESRRRPSPDFFKYSPGFVDICGVKAPVRIDGGEAFWDR